MFSLSSTNAREPSRQLLKNASHDERRGECNGFTTPDDQPYASVRLYHFPIGTFYIEELEVEHFNPEDRLYMLTQLFQFTLEGAFESSTLSPKFYMGPFHGPFSEDHPYQRLGFVPYTPTEEERTFATNSDRQKRQDMISPVTTPTYHWLHLSQEAFAGWVDHIIDHPFTPKSLGYNNAIQVRKRFIQHILMQTTPLFVTLTPSSVVTPTPAPIDTQFIISMLELIQHISTAPRTPLTVTPTLPPIAKIFANIMEYV